MIQPRSKSGSILFLDVEGTNLGDDTVTDQLSMFTAMMSSGLIIFARDVVGNSDIDFLYRILAQEWLCVSKQNRPSNCYTK